MMMKAGHYARFPDSGFALSFWFAMLRSHLTNRGRSRGWSIFGVGEARGGSISAAICDRGATRPKSKSGAIRRTRAFRGVWRRCSLLTDPYGYGRHSRLASHHQLLLRGLLLFMRWLLKILLVAIALVANHNRRRISSFSTPWTFETALKTAFSVPILSGE